MPRRKQLKVPIAALLAIVIAVLAYFLWHRGDDGVTEPPGCEAGPTVAGIDVSVYQEDIAWKRVRRAGIRFAFVRASDGFDRPDEYFSKNWSATSKVKTSLLFN